MAFQTFTPIQYLMIDIASNYGLDKETWDYRINWFHTSLEIHLQSPKDLNTNAIFKAFLKEAAEPALFYAGCLAYRKAIKGETVSYPISLDATASGAQLLSVLIGCEASARLCNVVDTGDREDLYTNVNDLMNQRLKGQEPVDRKDSKSAVMTSLYGSTAEPRKVFGEGDRLDTFYDVMTEELPGIWELNQSLLGLADPTADEYSWVLPDNFHVKTRVMTTVETPIDFLGETHLVPRKVQGPVERDLSLGANTTHSVDGMVVREITRRCRYDADKIKRIQFGLKSGYIFPKSTMERPEDELVIKLWDHYMVSGFLSARILELLDEENLWWVDKDVILALIDTLPKKPFDVLSVHDCFRVHPNYGNDLRRQYNQILSDIAKSNLLQYIVSQIAGEELDVQRYGFLDQQVLEANYALS